jgi:hypothetical protein
MRIAREQLRARHDPTVNAIAALVDLLLDPRGLQRMRLFRRAEACKRGDLALAHDRNRRHAGAHRLPIDMDGAGAALTKSATEARIA